MSEWVIFALAMFTLLVGIFGIVLAGAGIKARNESGPGGKHWPPPGAS
jgi:hypothetical protein